jgi:hypothetical protein
MLFDLSSLKVRVARNARRGADAGFQRKGRRLPRELGAKARSWWSLDRENHTGGSS